MYFFIEGLQDGTFKDELTRYPSPMMDNIKERADYFIRIEENSRGGSQTSQPKSDKGRILARSQPSPKPKEGHQGRKPNVGILHPTLP